MKTATLTQPRPLYPASIPVLAFFVKGRPVLGGSQPERWRSISVSNHLHKPGRGTRRYNAPETREWIKCVWVETLMERHLSGWEPPKPARKLAITCTFYGVRGDADNYAKSTLDGLKIGLGLDDKWFNPVTVSKLPKGFAGQGCLIEVWDGEQTDAA